MDAAVVEKHQFFRIQFSGRSYLDSVIRIWFVVTSKKLDDPNTVDEGDLTNTYFIFIGVEFLHSKVQPKVRNIHGAGGVFNVVLTAVYSATSAFNYLGVSRVDQIAGIRNGEVERSLISINF